MESPGPDDVRRAAERTSRHARYVRVQEETITRWANGVDPEIVRPGPRPAELQFHGTPANAARWTLLLDCLNFCFWSMDGPLWSVEYAGRRWVRYPALVAALRRAIDADPGWLQADRWASAEPADIERIFAGDGRIPLFDDRLRLVRETGSVLVERYGGEALNLAEQAGFDAARIASEVAAAFVGFRDVPVYQGQPAPILKRAQIFASDLAGMLADNDGPPIRNLDLLTAFADYRIPQILRHMGILVLDPSLETRIESSQLIDAASEEEIELRACGIHAVELMAHALRQKRGVDKPAWVVDEYLWDHSHDPDVKLQHHRTVTIYY